MPERPQLVLRAGMIGNIRLPDEAVGAALGNTAAIVMEGMGKELGKQGDETDLAQFFSNTPAVLRLVSGLAAGADQIMAGAIPGAETEVREETKGNVDFDLHCILPFSTDVYRDESIASSVSTEDA
ncbi:MAG: hypothetical protein AAGH89_13915, partial [Verrucomicrobiota bacterium]